MEKDKDPETDKYIKKHKEKFRIDIRKEKMHKEIQKRREKLEHHPKPIQKSKKKS